MNIRKDCSEIDRALDEGLSGHKTSLSSEAKLHLAECRRCSALLKAMNDSEQIQAPELRLDRIESALLRTLRPVRPLPPAWVFFAVFAAIFVVLVAIGAYRLGPFGWDVLSLSQKLVIFTSLGASAALLSFAAVSQMAPASRHRFSPALVPVAAFVLLAIATAAVFQYRRDPDFVRAGIGCLTAGIPYAIPAAILFWLVLRRGVVLHPMASGAISGMLAGLIGTSVLEVHCTILDAWHILVWHLGICVVGALLGLLAGFLGSKVRQNFFKQPV